MHSHQKELSDISLCTCTAVRPDDGPTRGGSNARLLPHLTQQSSANSRILRIHDCWTVVMRPYRSKEGVARRDERQRLRTEGRQRAPPRLNAPRPQTLRADDDRSARAVSSRYDGYGPAVRTVRALTAGQRERRARHRGAHARPHHAGVTTLNSSKYIFNTG